MKKWYYFVVPAAMLAVFTVFYFMHLKETEQKEIERKQEVDRQLLAEQQKKRDAEEKARLDAERRTAERQAEEARKEAERVAKWNREGQEIKDATDKANAEADQHAKRVAALEVQLAELRTLKEKTNREYMDMAKNVELADAERRAAEFEIQRMTEMIARRAATALTRPPSVQAPSS